MTEQSGEVLRINRAQYERMRNDASRRAPEEACGIVAGKNGRAGRVYVITNALHSPTAYRMAAQDQIDAFLEIEKENLEILAIYHSHPTGPEFPSKTDVTEFTFPGVFTMIWYTGETGWECRIFLIEGTMILEVVLEINEDE